MLAVAESVHRVRYLPEAHVMAVHAGHVTVVLLEPVVASLFL